MIGMHEIYNLVQNLIISEEKIEQESIVIPLTMFFFDTCGWSIVGNSTLLNGVFTCKQPMLIESIGSDRDLFLSASQGLIKGLIATKLNPIKFNADRVTIMITCTQDNWEHVT